MATTVCEAILTRDFTPEGSAPLTGDEVASYLAVLVRLCPLRDAYRLAAIDGRFSEEEARELTRIAGALGIDPGLSVDVRAIALEEIRLHREFAVLVRTARG